MKTKLTYIAPLLVAGGVAVAIAVGPVAAAASGQAAAGAAGGNGATAPSDSSQSAQSCVSLGTTHNLCGSPGNAQIYDAPPQVDYFPYGGGAS